MNDELNQLLKPPNVEPMPTSGQDALLANTMKVLHRQRHLRQLGRAVFTLAMLAGSITLGLLLAPKPSDMVMSIAQPSAATKPPLLTAAELEIEAEKAPTAAQASQFYRQAGDRFLEASDIRSALRCYRLHLAEGGPTSYTVATSDSWLLLSIKTNTSTGE
jgi:hypothetical protein